MSRLWPILACLLLLPLASGAVRLAPAEEVSGASCARACPCEAPAEAEADEADTPRHAQGCPGRGADGPCPAGCDDCPCCPGGLVALIHSVTILPPVPALGEALYGPPERWARGISERLFIPPELTSV